MTLSEATELIRPGIPTHSTQSVWADLGCGQGAFTRALAKILGNGNKIHAMDKDDQHIEDLAGGAQIVFSKVNVEYDALPVSNLDGILMANVLHYIKDQSGFIERIKQYLKPDGRIILIEYDSENSNPWVPFPVSLKKAKALFPASGFEVIDKIGERGSIFGEHKMYACSIRR